MDAIYEHAILYLQLYLVAAILYTCSIVPAILAFAIFFPAQLSGHRGGLAFIDAAEFVCGKETYIKGQCSQNKVFSYFLTQNLFPKLLLCQQRWS